METMKKILEEGEEVMQKLEWIKCPICGNKTRLKMRDDTTIKNFPLYCPKCKQESLIEIEKMKLKVVREPDAIDAEPLECK